MSIQNQKKTFSKKKLIEKFEMQTPKYTEYKIILTSKDICTVYCCILKCSNGVALFTNSHFPIFISLTNMCIGFLKGITKLL